MAKSLIVAPFQGFPRELFQFFQELAQNNNRQWFAENRSRYEDYYLKPSLAFLHALQPRMEKVSRYLVTVPKKGGGSLMRIYRDTRFSKNKDPYKTHVGLSIRHKLMGDIHAPGLYVHVGDDECLFAAGVWLPPRNELLQIRENIDADRAGWKRVKQHPKFKARFHLSGESLKTAPRGTDPNHPLIEDLRRTSYCAVMKLTRKQVMRSDLVDEVVQAASESRPLMKFLCDSIGIPY